MKKDKNNSQPNLFNVEDLGFSPEQAMNILKVAKEKADKDNAKLNAINEVKNSILFCQAKNSTIANTNGYWDDKPEIYTLHYAYTKTTSKGTTTEIATENKHKSFFVEIARMSAGSELAKAINNVLNPTKPTAETTA